MKFCDYLLIVLCVIGLCLAPWAFTRPCFCPDLNFLNTGEIGDTIGGITSPFVGMLSVILLWLTFREQRNFNKMQAQDNRINHLLTIHSDLNSLNNRVVYKYKEDTCDRSGNGILTLIKLSQTNANISFDYLELNGLLRECIQARIMCFQIKDFSAYLDNDSRKLFNSLTLNYLHSLCEFQKSISRQNVYGNTKDSYTDEEFESEINKLLEVIHSEIITINQELVRYERIN